MAKRKITVTVDEELVERLQHHGGNLSALVNEALESRLADLARNAALSDLVAELTALYGEPTPAEMAEARAAFDELDGVTSTDAA
jgi:post-segregation antitoxin (ccd killing protein)